MPKLRFQRIDAAELLPEAAQLRLCQAESQIIDALLPSRNEVLHPYENGMLGQLRELVIRPQELVIDELRQSLVKTQQLVNQFMLGTHNQFGRGRWRGRPQIGNKVANR